MNVSCQSDKSYNCDKCDVNEVSVGIIILMHDDTNLSSSFPISCQTLPKDSNNNSDIIAVSSNPQLPIQTRTPVAPKCSRQLFLYENAWRFMFGRQNLDVMPGILKLFCVVTNVI